MRGMTITGEERARFRRRARDVLAVRSTSNNLLRSELALALLR